MEKPTGGWLRVLSAGGYLLMAVGIVGLAASRKLFSPAAPVILTQLAAASLMIWARIAFGRRSFHFAANPTEGGLVTAGPYRFIRHPIYASACLFVWAGVLANLSWQAVLGGLLVLAGTLLRVSCEETLIPQTYPEYKAYAARTWRMIPYVF